MRFREISKSIRRLTLSSGKGLGLWLLIPGLSSSAPAAESVATPSHLPAAAETLFTEHCAKCHANGKHKGDFEIASLSSDFSDRKNRERWLSVLDQLQSGKMPPKKEPRPPAESVAPLVTWIGQEATSAEAARRAAQGRVVLRRLNRSEYANTIRDLLDVHVDLSDILPPDTSVTGFDNNAEAAHTSSYLLANYLEAADRALNEAIANQPRPWEIHKRFDIREEKSVQRTGSVYRHTEDGVAIFSAWESANIRVTLWNFTTHFRGQYHFRISGHGFQSEAKPIDFHVTTGTFKEVTEERLVDYFSVPTDQPSTIEFTEQLEPDNHLRIVADGLPALPPTVEKVGADKYTGPGLVIQWVDIDGPLVTSWPPPSHQHLFGDLKLAPMPRPGDAKRSEVVSDHPMEDAEQILRRFARKAFRRPVTDADIQPYLNRVRAKLENHTTFEQAVRVGLRGILVAPDFLFLHEKSVPVHSAATAALPPASNAQSATVTPARVLDEDSLASRLSYFLWSSMPDEELLKLAETHRLHDPAVLRQQVERLLSDPKAHAFTENFTGQWLSLRAIDSTTPDRMLYPEYDDILKVAMVKETTDFFEEVLQKNLSVAQFVDSDFTFLNARLAQHYGIPGVEGANMRKVTLPPGSHRGGVMTMASVLKVTANGTTTSPVIRGAWVLDRILGTPPPKPPADVEAIEPDIRGATTIRAQLAKHRHNTTCATCHSKIDPPGFALESFDVIGGWREQYRSLGDGKPHDVNGRRVRYSPGPKVDPSDALPNGGSFHDIDELKKLLLQDPDQLARCLAEKLLAYGTGAPPTPMDKPEIESIVQRVRDQHYGLKSLIHEIVQSPLFQTK